MDKKIHHVVKASVSNKCHLYRQKNLIEQFLVTDIYFHMLTLHFFLPSPQLAKFQMDTVIAIMC